MSRFPESLNKSLVDILLGRAPNSTRWNVAPHPSKPGFILRVEILDENNNPKWVLPENAELHYPSLWQANEALAEIDAKKKVQLIAALLESKTPAVPKVGESIYSVAVNDLIPGTSVNVFLVDQWLPATITSVEKTIDSAIIRLAINDRTARVSYGDETQVVFA